MEVKMELNNYPLRLIPQALHTADALLLRHGPCCAIVPLDASTVTREINLAFMQQQRTSGGSQ